MAPACSYLPTPQIWSHYYMPASPVTKSYLFCLVKSNFAAPFILLLQVSTISQLDLVTFQTGLCFKFLFTLLSQNWPQSYLSPVVKVIFLISWFYYIAPFKWIFIAFKIQFWLHGLGYGIWPLYSSFFCLGEPASFALDKSNAQASYF